MLIKASAEELKEKFLDTIKSIKRADINRLELMKWNTNLVEYHLERLKALEGLFANQLMYSLKGGEIKEMLMHLIDITESITEYEKTLQELRARADAALDNLLSVMEDNELDRLRALYSLRARAQL